MSTIKEKKEFFLRAIQVPIGANADMETGFPIEYTITLPDGVNQVVKNRFLAGHFPNEDVFKKLFESQTFKLNVGDTASTTTQGLVKVGTEAQLLQRLTVDADGFTLIYPISIVEDVLMSNVIDITYTAPNLIITYRNGSTLSINLGSTSSTPRWHIVNTTNDLLTLAGVAGDVAIVADIKNQVFAHDGADWTPTTIRLSDQTSVTETTSTYDIKVTYNGSTTTLVSIPKQNYITASRIGTVTTLTYLSPTGGVLWTHTIQENILVTAFNNPDGSISLYNGAVNITNLITTIPASTSGSGFTMRYGIVTPSNSTGANGDSYLNTNTGEWYSKESGAWVLKYCMAACAGSNPNPTNDYSFKIKTNGGITLDQGTEHTVVLYDNLGDTYDVSDIFNNTNHTLLIPAGETFTLSVDLSGRLYGGNEGVNGRIRLIVETTSGTNLVTREYTGTFNQGEEAYVHGTGSITIPSDTVDRTVRFIIVAPLFDGEMQSLTLVNNA
jgi:hypothetical protein